MAKAPDSSGVMRLAAKAKRKDVWKDLYDKTKEKHIHTIDQSTNKHVSNSELTKGQKKFVHHFSSLWMGSCAPDIAIKQS